MAADVSRLNRMMSLDGIHGRGKREYHLENAKINGRKRRLTIEKKLIIVKRTRKGPATHCG